MSTEEAFSTQWRNDTCQPKHVPQTHQMSTCKKKKKNVNDTHTQDAQWKGKWMCFMVTIITFFLGKKRIIIVIEISWTDIHRNLYLKCLTFWELVKSSDVQHLFPWHQDFNSRNKVYRDWKIWPAPKKVQILVFWCQFFWHSKIWQARINV